MEEQYTLVTETGINGIRLDKYLSDRLPDAITRSFLQKLIKEEQVTVDGRLQKANYKLKPEQTIQITIPPAEETAILPEDIHLIFYTRIMTFSLSTSQKIWWFIHLPDIIPAL